MTVLLAHVSPHGALLFLIPVVLVIVWIRIRAWQERRDQQTFAEFLVLSRRHDAWRIEQVVPDDSAPPRRRPPAQAPWRG